MARLTTASRTFRMLQRASRVCGRLAKQQKFILNATSPRCFAPSGNGHTLLCNEMPERQEHSVHPRSVLPCRVHRYHWGFGRDRFDCWKKRPCQGTGERIPSASRNRKRPISNADGAGTGRRRTTAGTQFGSMHFAGEPGQISRSCHAATERSPMARQFEAATSQRPRPAVSEQVLALDNATGRDILTTSSALS